MKPSTCVKRAFRKFKKTTPNTNVSLKAFAKSNLGNGSPIEEQCLAWLANKGVK